VGKKILKKGGGGGGTVETEYFIHSFDGKSEICQNMYVQKYTELRLIPILWPANTKLSEKP